MHKLEWFSEIWERGKHQEKMTLEREMHLVQKFYGGKGFPFVAVVAHSRRRDFSRSCTVVSAGSFIQLSTSRLQVIVQFCMNDNGERGATAGRNGDMNYLLLV